MDLTNNKMAVDFENLSLVEIWDNRTCNQELVDDYFANLQDFDEEHDKFVSYDVLVVFFVETIRCKSSYKSTRFHCQNINCVCL